MRDPSEPITQAGHCIVLGVATYSAEELRLLDELEDAVQTSGDDAPIVQVFDVLDCDAPGDFARWIPGIGDVYRTPIVGVFVDGKLVDQATGPSDVQTTLRRFHVLNHDKGTVGTSGRR